MSAYCCVKLDPFINIELHVSELKSATSPVIQITKISTIIKILKTMKIQRETRVCPLCIQCKIPWPDLKLTWTKFRIKPVNTILSTRNAGFSWTQSRSFFCFFFFLISTWEKNLGLKIIYVALLSRTTSNCTDRGCGSARGDFPTYSDSRGWTQKGMRSHIITVHQQMQVQFLLSIF